MAGDTLRFAPSDLEELATRLTAAGGAPADIAALVAHHLVDANLCGHDSHGVLRIPSYIEMVDRGQLRPAARPTVVQERPTTATLDGAHGYGFTTMNAALQLGAQKARSAGLAAVAIRHCGHIGRLGGWVEAVAKEGLIGLVVVGALGQGLGGATAFGGAARVLGTNPWAIGVPVADGEPVIMDFATSAVAEGKLRVARAKGQNVPPGWIVASDGTPTTDVEQFYRGGMLLPFGGHKGYGLSVMAAMLAALAGGERAGRLNGVFLLILDPAAFGDADAYLDATAAGVDVLHAMPASPGSSPVQAPGDPERASRWLRGRAIPLPRETWRQLRVLAERFAVPLPKPSRQRQLLGEYLVDEFGLSPAQILAAVDRQRQQAAGAGARLKLLGEVLTDMGHLDLDRVAGALRRQREDDQLSEHEAATERSAPRAS